MLPLPVAPLPLSPTIATVFTLLDSEEDCLSYEVLLNAPVVANHSHSILYDPVKTCYTMGLYVSVFLLVCVPLEVCNHILIIFAPQMSFSMWTHGILLLVESIDM